MIVSPTISNGEIGVVFATYIISATSSPTSFGAVDLPPGLSLDGASGKISGTPTAAGTYAVTISATNGFGTGTATLVVTVAPISFSHIVNFSARALSGTGTNSLILGFAVSGNGKNLLVRGIGPGLSLFGISDYLPAPTLTMFDNFGGVTATNSGWQVDSGGQNDVASISATTASVGAFALADGSLDAALLITVDGGTHTAILRDSKGATGIGLIEIYDAGGNPYASLTNVSARMNVTGGNGVLIAGLVIGGNSPKTVLIRGIGPTLSEFGVVGVLVDPRIAIFSGQTQIASNSNWSSGTNIPTQIVAASASVGAFPLPLGSNDAALIIKLQPGAYTVQVTSLSGATGVALVEIYDASQWAP